MTPCVTFNTWWKLNHCGQQASQTGPGRPADVWVPALFVGQWVPLDGVKFMWVPETSERSPIAHLLKPRWFLHPDGLLTDTAAFPPPGPETYAPWGRGLAVLLPQLLEHPTSQGEPGGCGVSEGPGSGTWVSFFPMLFTGPLAPNLSLASCGDGASESLVFGKRLFSAVSCDLVDCVSQTISLSEASVPVAVTQRQREIPRMSCHRGAFSDIEVTIVPHGLTIGVIRWPLVVRDFWSLRRSWELCHPVCVYVCDNSVCVITNVYVITVGVVTGMCVCVITVCVVTGVCI